MKSSALPAELASVWRKMGWFQAGSLVSIAFYVGMNAVLVISMIRYMNSSAPPAASAVEPSGRTYKWDMTPAMQDFVKAPDNAIGVDGMVGPWLVGKSLTLMDLPGFGPYPQQVDRDECGVLCESKTECSAAVWTCGRWCHLKRPATVLPTIPVRCSFVYERGKHDAYRTFAQGRKTTSGVFPPLPLKKSTVVVIMRCREPTDWIQEVLRRLPAADDAPVQAVMYERCEVPQERWTNIGNTTVLRQAVATNLASSRVLTSHLLVNLRAHARGLFQQAAFISAGSEAKVKEYVASHDAGASTSEPLSALPWTQWNLNEWVDVLTTSPMPMSIGAGLHWVTTDTVDTKVPERLQDFGELLMRSGSVEEAWEARGFPRCPAGAVDPARPLTSASKTAIVTYLSDSAFMVSARVLIHSLQRSGCQSDIVVALIPKSAQLQFELRREFPGVKVVVWPYLTPPQNSREHARWRDNYSKLNLFNMTQYDGVFYIDADIVALKNPDSLFSHKVVQDSLTPYVGSPDWGFWSQPPSTKSNGGVLFCRPSSKLFACMMDLIHTVPGDEWNSVEAEQGYLRWFFGDQWTQMPYTFNAQKTIMYSMPEIWDEEDITLLHYVGVKPHKTWSTPEWFRTYREDQLRQELQSVDQADDERDDFDVLAKRWRINYFSLANFSKTMSIFSVYHDQRSYSVLQERLDNFYDKDLYVPLSLMLPVAPNNLSTRQMMPELADPVLQLQLGEFGGILAMAKATWYDKPWIGFTTYSEHRKSSWREGLAIDWVKVERAMKEGGYQNRVLFWYGIFAGDYWELMEQHHKGMPAVIRAVLGKMGYRDDQLTMPKNTFWAFGNYMLMPYEVLQGYAIFAEHFLKTFREMYPEGCPFETMETHTPNWQARCAGYTTERLIHVWGTLTKVRFEFVVDDEPLRYRAGCRASPVHCRKDV